MRRFKQKRAVLLFVFFFFFFSSISSLSNLDRFHSFVTTHFSLSLSSLLSSLYLFSLLLLVSPPIKIRFKTRTASLSERPGSALEARRRASKGPELSLPPVTPFPPVVYDGSSDCSRGRRVIRVRVRGPFRFRISRTSFLRPFVSSSSCSSTSLPPRALLSSSTAFYRSYFYNRTYGRAIVGTCLGSSREIARSRVASELISSRFKRTMGDDMKKERERKRGKEKKGVADDACLTRADLIIRCCVI